MDAKLLLVKAITLLFRESQLQDRTDNSADLIKRIISDLKMPEQTLDTGQGREIMISLRATAIWMANNPVTHEYDRAELLQRIRINIGDEVSLYEAILEGFEEIEEQERIKKICFQYSEQLKNYIRQTEVREIIRDASYRATFNPDEVDWSTLINELTSKLEPYANLKEETIVGELGDVDFNNIENLTKMLQRASEEVAVGGGLKCGIQGINRMLGDHEAFLRGESWVIGALQHNFKSGFLMSLLRGFVTYNKPRMLDEKKKPLILFITLENTIEQNVLWLYASFKEQETKQYCDVRNIDIMEAAQYLKEKFEVNGFHVKMRRFNPTEFTYRDFVNVILNYEAEGYEIHSILLDYLNMMNKTGCVQTTIGSDTRDLFRRIRNTTNPRKILFVTPHQLSSEAKQLVRQDVQDFVKQIANKGYYDSCKVLDQEVDGEMYIHIEKKNGQSYLTVQRGKHRKAGKITPDEDCFTVLPFQEVGAIVDDHGSVDLSLKKIPSNSDLW